MIFFTIEFACCLLVFLVLYWGVLKLFGLEAQNICLLFFNYAIIAWINPYFALVVFVYTIVIYIFSLLIFEFDSVLAFTCCVGIVLLNLCFFKYFHAIKDSFDIFIGLFGFSGKQIDIIFPLGLSFYTFASVTYLHSVLKGNIPQEFFFLACYLSFFPTFISGPIMRSQYFFSQLYSNRELKYISLIITLILLGITKKIFIANYLQIYSEPILQNPSTYSSVSLLLGIYAYSVQLYCDFSGYVNLVSAFALMIGFRLPSNFNMPYMARNIKDFWARWHISLSTFIRDYIYIPLGGNRKGFFLAQVFVLISFGLSGIWHGNTWNFLIWGLLHGLAIIFVNILRFYDIKIKLPYISSIITFHFVTFAWVFFVFTDISDSFLYIQSLVNNTSMQVSNFEWECLIACMFCFLIYPYMKHTIKLSCLVLDSIPLLLQPLLVAFLVCVIIGLSANGIPNFIYAGF
ncbi:MBOAT family protein [Helicobacter muridarum]|uniref:Alginate O-acetyltransferase n=1 Tax=Helicobacter muridarum TaxID=216 RepID=A0A099TZI7_9HELI|nr:MBOAT family O-acyltransferase [Helicobacter muridarum]TLD97984.1 MBOAT family protein [Helicobacter muridarum]STQ85752.1 alginate O-acetyltransferase [Helicobacter muridarum]